MAKHVEAPEIWFAAQRVIRTVLVNLVVILPVVNISLPLVVEAFTGNGVPAEVTILVNAIVAGVLVVTGVLTRIIAIPAVNDFLTSLGAGSVPKSEVADLARQATADRDAAAAREALRDEPNTDY